MPRITWLFAFIAIPSFVLSGCSNRDRMDDSPFDRVDSGMVSFDDSGTPPPGRDAGGTRDAGPMPSEDAGKRDGGRSDGGTTPDGGAMDGGSAPDAARDAGPPPMCPDSDLAGMLGDMVAMGSTVGASDAVTASCGLSGGPDMVYLWTAPHAGTFTFATNGSGHDTVLSVRMGGMCSGAEIACNDDFAGLDSRVDVTLASGDAIALVVEGYDGDVGDYVLHVWEGVPASESACHDGMDDDRDGDIDCLDYDCDTDPGCTETMCTDGTDNDGDGDTDCMDYDCDSDPACQETLCADGIDNEGDGAIDCDDFDCYSDPSCYEADCTNGIDDDSDGDVDCDDYDCWFDPACP